MIADNRRSLCCCPPMPMSKISLQQCGRSFAEEIETDSSKDRRVGGFRRKFGRDRLAERASARSRPGNLFQIRGSAESGGARGQVEIPTELTWCRSARGINISGCCFDTNPFPPGSATPPLRLIFYHLPDSRFQISSPTGGILKPPPPRCRAPRLKRTQLDILFIFN